MTEIREAVFEDQKWISKLFDQNKEILGMMSGGTVFWRWYQGGNPREHFLVIPELAFAHYLKKKDGTKVLYEMAVSASAKRQGLGRRLLDKIGRPLELKTNADSPESNTFYRSYGMTCVGQKTAGNGKLLNIYQAF